MASDEKKGSCPPLINRTEDMRVLVDYTKWQASLWPDADVEELSRKAMQMRRGESE